MTSDRYEEIRKDMGLVFQMSVNSKMLLTVGTLLISTLAAPAVHFRRDFITEIEGATALSGTMSMSVGVALLFGNLSTFFVGVYMLQFVRERAKAASRTRAEIEEQLRFEDFVMWFQVFGTIAVFVPLVPLVVVGLFPGLIAPMYDAGITLFRPFEAVPVDTRLVAVVSGGGLGTLLGAMWWLVR